MAYSIGSLGCSIRKDGEMMAAADVVIALEQYEELLAGVTEQANKRKEAEARAELLIEDIEDLRAQLHDASQFEIYMTDELAKAKAQRDAAIQAINDVTTIIQTGMYQEGFEIALNDWVKRSAWPLQRRVETAV